jgi:putative redox protein
MVRIEIRYEGTLHCSAEHAPSGTTLGTDAPVDNHGRGESFSPTDLVAAALGTCVATTMALVAERHGYDMSGASVSVEKEMAGVPRRRIARLPALVSVPVDPGPEGRARLEAAALHCPVHASLHPELDAPIAFQWGS